jgi:hypothetical protein
MHRKIGLPVVTQKEPQALAPVAPGAPPEKPI